MTGAQSYTSQMFCSCLLVTCRVLNFALDQVRGDKRTARWGTRNTVNLHFCCHPIRLSNNATTARLYSFEELEELPISLTVVARAVSTDKNSPCANHDLFATRSDTN